MLQLNSGITVLFWVDCFLCDQLVVSDHVTSRPQGPFFASKAQVFCSFSAMASQHGVGAPISQSTGIQQLLQAEKKAAEKVAEARKSKHFFSWLSLDSPQIDNSTASSHQPHCTSKCDSEHTHTHRHTQSLPCFVTSLRFVLHPMTVYCELSRLQVSRL